MMVDTYADLPDDLGDARVSFEKFEKSTDSLTKVKFFEEAVEILNNYLEENPASPHRPFISNLRHTYTKELITQLKNIKNPDWEVWCKYIFLLLLKVNKETKEILALHPELINEYKEFIKLRKDELIEVLNRDTNI